MKGPRAFPWKRLVIDEVDEGRFDVSIEISTDSIGQHFSMRCTEEEYVGLQRAAERSQAYAFDELNKVLPTLEVER